MISAEYKELNRILHNDAEYGISGQYYRDNVRQISDHGRLPILDYGCGKQTLSKALGPAYRVTDYDPCLPGLDAPPDQHPVVVCSDVLEHVEPEFVDDVLADIRRLCTDVAFFVVCLAPSTRTLADGRNAHLSLHPVEWWLNKLATANFTLQVRKSPEKTVHSCWFIVQ